MIHSENIAEIAAALSKAQSELMPVKRESLNPFFKSKYADLSAIIEGAKVVLAKNNLAVTQLVSSRDGTKDTELVTLLIHSSGQWFKSVVIVPVAKPDAQTLGAAITYMRRYSFAAIVGIATEDDDGNTASAPATTYAKPTPTVVPSKLESTVAIKGEDIFDRHNPEHMRILKTIAERGGYKGNILSKSHEFDANKITLVGLKEIDWSSV